MRNDKKRKQSETVWKNRTLLNSIGDRKQIQTNKTQPTTIEPNPKQQTSIQDNLNDLKNH